MEENNQLKRAIYQYENTLAQLDSIFRRDHDKEECIYELKKLTENQLHQIIRLQKEKSSGGMSPNEDLLIERNDLITSLRSLEEKLKESVQKESEA